MPDHIKKTYNNYKIGYGILSLQGKGAKHSNRCSNRNIDSEKNKWYQLMQYSSVRTFYLPYHYPIKTYNSHFDSRNPPYWKMCACFRPVNEGISVCGTRIHIQLYINDIENGKLPEKIQELRRRIVCPSCNFRFADRIL